MRQTVTGHGQDGRQGIKLEEADVELLKNRKKEEVEEIKKTEEGEILWKNKK